MAYPGEFEQTTDLSAGKPASAIVRVQQICKERMEEIRAQMMELAMTEKSLLAEQARLTEELRQIEAVLDMTRPNQATDTNPHPSRGLIQAPTGFRINTTRAAEAGLKG